VLLACARGLRAALDGFGTPVVVLELLALP